MCKLYVIGTTQTKTKNATYEYVIVSNDDSYSNEKSKTFPRKSRKLNKIRTTQLAIIAGVEEAIKNGFVSVEIFTCEEHFKVMFDNNNIQKWQQKGWKLSNGKTNRKNIDLNIKLLSLSKKITIKVKCLGYERYKLLRKIIAKQRN